MWFLHTNIRFVQMHQTNYFERNTFDTDIMYLEVSAGIKSHLFWRTMRWSCGSQNRPPLTLIHSNLLHIVLLNTYSQCEVNIYMLCMLITTFKVKTVCRLKICCQWHFMKYCKIGINGFFSLQASLNKLFFIFTFCALFILKVHQNLRLKNLHIPDW